MARVRGTMKEVPEIEVNVDTVYIRKNIVRIEDDDFIGWEYEETQYNKDEFIELISSENKDLKQKLEIQQMVIDDLLLNVIPMLLMGGGV